MRLGRPPAHIQPYFGQDGLCDHHMDSINACQIHAGDAVQLTPQIEPRGVATTTNPARLLFPATRLSPSMP